MKNRKRALVLALIVFLLVSLASVHFATYSANAQSGNPTSTSAQAQLVSAFKAVSVADSSGANVSSLAAMLNQAAALMDQANSVSKSNPTLAQTLYSQSQTLSSKVASLAPAVGSQGAILKRNAEIAYVVEMLILGTLAILAYLYTPKLFWNFWTKNHRKLKVVKKKAVTDVEALSILLLIIFILGLGLTYNYFWNGGTGAVTQPYSEIALLGSNQTLSDYPQNVSVGQNFTLYLHVGNYEGHVIYYRVLAIVANESSVVNQTTTLNIPPITSYDFVLANNQTSLRQATLALNTPGTNVKLVFELWTYSIDQGRFDYHSEWTQLLLNVTRS
ncbi:MAG: DUF1616 domain-containing protein [Nitrososphaerota archaeon]|nr:DUF1616 domain-containing protein [Nitrososphaerota archaeon]